MNELREELQARGITIQGKLKPALQNDLTVVLKGALDPQPTTNTSLNLQHYEVLDCEPLHDFKGRAYNLLKEIPILLTTPLKEDVELIQTTVPKQKVSGALLRLATIKLYLKLSRHSDVDKRIIQLMGTLVKISELLYATDNIRTPKSILQLHNVAWMHHEL